MSWKSSIPRSALEAYLTGLASMAGVITAMQLRDPYSSVRLRAGELVDRLKEVRR